MQTLFNALNAHNIPTPNRKLDNGGFTRWGKNSRYWATRLGNGGWCFGDWTNGVQHYAFPDTNRRISRAEARSLSGRLWLERELFHTEQALRHSHAMDAAKATLEPCKPAIGECHPYLTAKGITASEGAYINPETNILEIPLYDTHDQMWNIQQIYPDGTKRFLSGGRTKGCFHPIGDFYDQVRMIVCEGYATAVSIHTATQIPAVAAMSAGNIEPVVRELMRKLPDFEIIIAADNDCGKPTNTGRDTAIAVGKKFGLTVIVPQFPADATGMSDFNDLHKRCGIDAVKQQFNQGGISC